MAMDVAASVLHVAMAALSALWLHLMWLLWKKRESRFCSCFAHFDSMLCGVRIATKRSKTIILEGGGGIFWRYLSKF